MNFIRIAIVMILGLMGFVLVRSHFIWSIPYLVIHLSVIAWMKHRGDLEIDLSPKFVPAIFIVLQLLYSFAIFYEIQQMGLDAENFDKQIKFNLIRIGLLVVEYPLMLEFFRKPKFERY